MTLDNMKSTSQAGSPKIQRYPLHGGPSVIFEAMRQDGVVIIEGFLNPEQIKRINEEVDPHLAQLQHDRSLTSSLESHLPPETKRLYGLSEISKTFRHDVLNHGLMHEVCKKVFDETGDYWLASAAVLQHAPGAPRQHLHHDYMPHPLIDNGPGGPECLINFFTALTDFTPESGATQFVWGSHTKHGITEPSDEHPIAMAEVKAGDAILISGKMIHRGGDNNTKDFYRRALSIAVSTSLLSPMEANLRFSRPVVESMTPLAQKMIGWGTVSQFGIGMWTYDMRDLAENIGLKSSQSILKV